MNGKKDLVEAIAIYSIEAKALMHEEKQQFQIFLPKCQLKERCLNPQFLVIREAELIILKLQEENWMEVLDSVLKMVIKE